MKKKAWILLTSIATVLVLAVVGTVAFLTVEDEDENIMLYGDIAVDQYEMERAQDGALQSFTQEKYLLPAYGTEMLNLEQSWNQVLGTDTVTANDTWTNLLWDDSQLSGTIDKFVFVENTGTNDVYFRTVIALEYPEDVSVASPLHYNIDNSGAFTWAEPTEMEYIYINGERYQVLVGLYNEILVSGEIARPSLLQVYMDGACTVEDMLLFGDDVNIYVKTQAVQADNFPDAATAVKEAFGNISESSHPWFNAAGEEAGTVTLSVNPQFDVHYDKYGNVLRVEAKNEDAQNLMAEDEKYRGRTCKYVIGDLVEEIGNAGYLELDADGNKKPVNVEISESSHLPNDQFFDGIEKETRHRCDKHKWDVEHHFHNHAKPDNTNAGKTIAFVTDDLNNSVLRVAQMVFLKKAQKLGYDAVILGTDISIRDQIDEKLISGVTNGTVGCVVWTADDSLYETMAQLSEQAYFVLPHYKHEYADTKDFVSCNIRSDSAKYGKQAAEFVLDQLAQKGITSGAIACSQATDNVTENEAIEAFCQAILTSGTEFVVSDTILEGRELVDATVAITTHINENPNLVAAFGASDYSAQAWALAMEQTGKTDLVMCGNNYTEYSLDLIAAGANAGIAVADTAGDSSDDVYFPVTPPAMAPISGIVAQPIKEEIEASVEALDSLLNGQILDKSEENWSVILDAPIAHIGGTGVSNSETYRPIIDEVIAFFSE